MSTSSDLASTGDLPTLRVSGPADLVEAVPFLLGFHPRESLVVIGLCGSKVVVTARIDLDDVTGSRSALGDTLRAIVRGGAREVVAIVIDDRAVPPDVGTDAAPGAALPWHALALETGTEATRAGATASDVLLVSGGRWWSYRCSDPDCCPGHGRPLAAGTSAVSAAATFAGLVALPDRASVAALLEPAPAERRRGVQVRLERAERASVASIVDGDGLRTQRSVKRALFAAARAADAPGPTSPLSDDDVARFGVALHALVIRDPVWIAIDDGRLDGRELWRDLARRLPGSYAAAPLFLFGWASWRAGNGALAGMAAERALASDTGYTAADLLLAAVAHGIDPRRLPRLRRTRST